MLVSLQWNIRALQRLEWTLYTIVRLQAYNHSIAQQKVYEYQRSAFRGNAIWPTDTEGDWVETEEETTRNDLFRLNLARAQTD